MKRNHKWRSWLFTAALALLAAFAFGGAAAAADNPDHPLTLTANTSISCDWTITKTAPSSLTLGVGEAFDVPYTVVVTKTCTGHIHGTVSGDIVSADDIPDVVVTISDGGANTAATVSGCTVVDHTFTCTYDADLASTVDGTVTAHATYHSGGTASGSTTYSFLHAPVSGDTVDVLDSDVSAPLATHLNHSETFHYTVRVSFPTCGAYTLHDTASAVDDHGTTVATATATVHVTVPCAGSGGCTLTQGYWKTHSKYGPAPSDATWNLLAPSGPDSTFFLSGKTWYQAFWTAPAGNAYYILAHQYMAARLNMLAGASTTSAVNAALAWATSFFNTYTPAQIGALKGGDALRQAAVANASTLESYNTGAIGPGHCDE